MRVRLLLFVASLSLVNAGAQTFSYVSALTDDVGKPTGLSLDVIDGITYLYVSDHNGGRVFKYNLTTGGRTQIGFPGRDPGQFVWPDAIGIDPATHDLYIADRQLHRVTRMKNDGTVLMKWGDSGTETNRFGYPNAGSAPGQFNEVQGVVVDPAGIIYTTEHENHRVQKFRVSQSGTDWRVETLAVWGSGGDAPGQFNTPYGITLDAAGNVWVADGYNSRLQQFTASGQFLRQIVVRDPTEPHLVCTWVAFDRAGEIWVSVTSDPNTGGDIENQRIEKFSASGTSLARWGHYGSEPGNFKLPFGIAIDPATHRAYVADWDNNRVQIFNVGDTSVPPPPPPSSSPITGTNQLVNLSARVTVAPGDSQRIAIAGFVVQGSVTKPVLVRAVGPGLASFGVSGVLANPRLQIFDRNGRVVAENDDWDAASDLNATADRVGAFRLASGSRDAALVVSLAPGNYTAQVTSPAGDGVALLEIYDTLPRPSDGTAKLVNLSTRGFVGTGEQQLIAGFAIVGDTPKRVLVRGIGPGLTKFGVAGVVADPSLQIFASGNPTAIAQNDNWETPQPVSGGAAPANATELATAARATGAFSLGSGSRDAAVVITLAPGTYSAVVSGVGGTSGAGMVEAYEVPTE
jgi:DNA-binding beta-propeller fold protein YncE